MPDNLTREQRSKCMSRIRSKWTLSERKIHNHLKGRKIKHTMHPEIKGSPDILLKDSNTVVFIDGCFWHRCPKCFQDPKSNMEYWAPKIERNVKRDKENRKHLKRMGYKVVRIWEHEVKNDPHRCIEKILL